MPIQPTIYPDQLLEKLGDKVSELLRGRLIPLVSEGPVALRILFVLDIQQLRDLKNARLKTDGPEGVRVMLSSDSGVEAALDFYYAGDDVRFTHSLAGLHLHEFAAALNTIEQAYNGRETAYQVACVDFHYATHPYLVTFSGRSANWYNYFKGEILRLKPAAFKKQLRHLAKKPAKATQAT
jgi:hypothetical protein